MRRTLETKQANRKQTRGERERIERWLAAGNDSTRTMIPLDTSNNFKPNRTPETSGSGLFAYRPENPAPSVIPSHPLDIRWPRAVFSFPILAPPTSPIALFPHTNTRKNTSSRPTDSSVRDRLALCRNFFPPPGICIATRPLRRRATTHR